MIFRQMLFGIQLKSAFTQLKNEGILFLYRGVGPPLAQKTVSYHIHKKSRPKSTFSAIVESHVWGVRWREENNDR